MNNWLIEKIHFALRCQFSHKNIKHLTFFFYSQTVNSKYNDSNLCSVSGFVNSVNLEHEYNLKAHSCGTLWGAETFDIFLSKSLWAAVINVDKIVWWINHTAHCFALHRILFLCQGSQFPLKNVYPICVASRMLHYSALAAGGSWWEIYKNISHSKQSVGPSHQSSCWLAFFLQPVGGK